MWIALLPLIISWPGFSAPVRDTYLSAVPSTVVKSIEVQQGSDKTPVETTAAAAPQIGERASDADAAQQQAEATIAQVEADMRNMKTFDEELRRNLAAQDKVKGGITQAFGLFRRQAGLAQDERDSALTKVQRLEAEVASLQHRIKVIEGEAAQHLADKATLEEANRKLIAQLTSIFQYGQAVQTGVCRILPQPSYYHTAIASAFQTT
jgi:chromosome segregation ATPase